MNVIAMDWVHIEDHQPMLAVINLKSLLQALCSLLLLHHLSGKSAAEKMTVPGFIDEHQGISKPIKKHSILQWIPVTKTGFCF